MITVSKARTELRRQCSTRVIMTDDDDVIVLFCSAAINVCATIPVPKGSVR